MDTSEALVVLVEPIPVFMVVQALSWKDRRTRKTSRTGKKPSSGLAEKTGQWNKASPRHVYDYVDACVRDEPCDASAMHRQ
ncbi:MAG: hypothetical protein RL291_1322 [Pseudomonadota bacterium]|jgi:hypothetical protein